MKKLLDLLHTDLADKSEKQHATKQKIDPVAIGEALGWLLKQGKARKLLRELMNYKTTINSALALESM